jgi:hypothetical protein
MLVCEWCDRAAAQFRCLHAKEGMTEVPACVCTACRQAEHEEQNRVAAQAAANLQVTEEQVQELTRQQQVHAEQLQQAQLQGGGGLVQVQQLQQQIVELERTMARLEESDRKSRGSNLIVGIPLAGRTAAPTREQVRDTLVHVTGVPPTWWW